jgi:periplasmic protein CpxP/Spy
MKIHHVLRRPGIVTAALLLTAPLASFAASPPGPDGGHDGRCGPPDFHDFRGPPPGPGFGGFHGGGLGGPGFGPPPFLAGLRLTDEQQDKVFAIVYAAAPAMRDGEKALRKAHEALRDINASPEYDENRVKGLADSAAKADSQLTVLRVHTEHQIYALLTPEQKKQLEERRREHGPGERGDHGDHGDRHEHNDHDDHKGS